MPCGAKNVDSPADCVCERCGGAAPQGDAYCTVCRGDRPSPPARTASVEEVMDWMEVTDENPFALAQYSFNRKTKKPVGRWLLDLPLGLCVETPGYRLPFPGR
jgi:hypothetical protein